MFSKTFFILAVSLAGVRATCEWNGYGANCSNSVGKTLTPGFTGVGLEQFCNIGTPKQGSCTLLLRSSIPQKFTELRSPDCNELMGFVTGGKQIIRF